MIGAVIGVVVGVTEWLVLLWQVSRAGWWVLASVVGLAVGNVIMQTVAGPVGLAIFVVFGAVTGTITGVALVWLLRRRTIQETDIFLLSSPS